MCKTQTRDEGMRIYDKCDKERKSGGKGKREKQILFYWDIEHTEDAIGEKS